MCCESTALFKMVFHLDVHYSSGKVVAGGAVAENAGNLHSYCPQELRTPTSNQSSEKTRICAEVNIFIREQMFPDGFFSLAEYVQKYSFLGEIFTFVQRGSPKLCF